MNEQICVGVTGLKIMGSPQTGFGVARSLKSLGYKVVGIDETPLTSAICSPYFDSIHTIKSLYTENIEEFAEDIKKIKRETSLSVIIPCCDSEIYFFSKYKKNLEKIGIKILIPSLESLKMTSKLCLYNLKKYGLNIPKTIIVSEKNKLNDLTKEFNFPIVCKGVLKDSYIAKDKTDLLIYFDRINEMLHGGQGKVIFQEFIKGDFYCATGVADSNNKLIRYIAMKKLGVDLTGATWCGLTIENNILREISERFVEITKWIGPFELEFIKDSNGKYQLFEINPRLPAYIYLATASDQNMPGAIVKLTLGKPVEKNISYTKDLVFTRLTEEVIYHKKYLDCLNINGKLQESVKIKKYD